MTMEKLFGRRSSSDDEHWMSVSDLMAGLMVIFLFIAITYIRPIVEIQAQIRNIVVAWKDHYVQLEKSFVTRFELSYCKINLAQYRLRDRIHIEVVHNHHLCLVHNFTTKRFGK